MRFKASKKDPPIGAVIVANIVGKDLKVEIDWTADETSLDVGDGIVLNTGASIIRYFARAAPQLNLYGNGALTRTEVDHWLTFTIGPLACDGEFEKALSYLETVITADNFLVDKKVSAADYAVYGALHASGHWQWLLSTNAAKGNTLQWYNFVGRLPEVKKVVAGLPKDAIPKPVKGGSVQKEGSKAKQAEPKQTKDEGKFVELPGAEVGKVVVRFPPEASGFLHIGHAKAVLLNQHYRNHFQGKLILRFDDTNPAKEKEEYEDVILEDLKLLEVKYDHFSRSSDHFETLLNYCEKMIKEGNAYVDNTDAETMKTEREARQESKNRSNPVDKNLGLWAEMKKGSEVGQTCAVRAKINMSSDNGCMRDPTIYRCKPETHPATGNKFKVYPTYDFTCPIVDSIEGVTHALRTTEYMDRDEQYFWFIAALGLRKPHVYAYSRLSMTNTVMSKRKLTWFVDNGAVDGWDDPRFPTVRGVLRRGLTVEALKQFILAQGSSRSVVFMEWDKIWAMNKKVIDPVAPRYTAIDHAYNVTVNVTGAKEECLMADKHPKDPAVGQKSVWRGTKVLIDGADAEALKEGENATFINWGNLKIKKVNRKGNQVISVDAETNLGDTDFKKTLKITWLAETAKAPFTPTMFVYYDHIITKPVLDKEDDFKNFIGTNTKCEVEAIGDPELKSLKKGDIIQVQRKGFFIVDSPFKPVSPNTCKPTAIRLISIPDGTAGSYGLPGKVAPAAFVPAAQGKKKNQPSPSNVQAKPSSDSQDQDDVAKINALIIEQGDKVRKMKEEKADKATLNGAVEVLKDLKASYKVATGAEWKPGTAAPAAKTSAAPATAGDAVQLDGKIAAQGEKVRLLKSDKKTDKSVVTAEVNVLLALKAGFKAATGNDWKLGASPPKVVQQASATGGSPVELGHKIAAQGNLVRKLKGEKADKKVVDQEVKTLVDLKAKYKEMTGQEWKAGEGGAAAAAVPAKAASPPSSGDALEQELGGRINLQGELVRKLKGDKADKADIDANVKILLDLKSKYKEKFGKDYQQPQSSAGASKKESGSGQKPKKNPPQKQQQTKDESKEAAAATAQKQTRLGMEARKEEHLADWYSQVIVKAELLEYYDVSGCYILRPWAFSIWEAIQAFFDGEIKKLGVQNCYFPIFVSQAALQKEKDHIADFAPEVAWVTRSGTTELAEPIAVRPTSETVMYPTFAKWIQSYRDLPLKLNQWCNVVRWEFKHPQPFLRTREFLWQEGHTAYAKKAEAEEEVLQILELYRAVYEDVLAIPVIRGRKTEKEKFAGGDYTTTVEAYVSAAGRAIQGATSHHLGQNFSKMFEVVFEDPETGEKQYVFQNSWGITTRTIGVLTMVHGDNQGLVLPPRVAMIQAVIVPCGITVGLKEEERKALYQACTEYESSLSAAGVKVRGDYRENYSPGWKFNHWELKGVPIRIELGPRDIKKGEYVAVRRDTGEKLTMKKDTIGADVPKLLEAIQSSMFSKAKKEMDEHVTVSTKWADFVKALESKHLIMAPFCGIPACEEEIKELSKSDVEADPGAPSMGAKSLCIPFEQPGSISKGMHCIKEGCKSEPKFYTLFGRSY